MDEAPLPPALDAHPTPSVLASVLSYDALENAERCVRLLGEQTVPLSAILVIDNHGPDPVPVEETTQLVDVPTTVARLDSNSGPAGGHATAAERFLDTDFDFIWMMDDDVQPARSCLDELLSTALAATQPSVVGPTIIDATSGRERNGWGWWGVLIPRAAVERAGVPRRDLFWGLEDQEYLRDRLPAAGFPLVRAHRAVVQLSTRPDWNDPERIAGVAFQRDKPDWKYYYELRNFTFRYLHDRRHLPFGTRAKSLVHYYLAYLRMLFSEAAGRRRKWTLAGRGVFDGATRRLGKRIEPTTGDRPPH